MNDQLRGLVMATVTSLIPLVKLFGLYDLSADQVAGLTLAFGNLSLVVAYLTRNLRTPS